MTVVKVLLVEDSEPDAHLVREVLRRVKGPTFEIRHADSLSAAFRLLEAEKFDIILLDLSLPDSPAEATFERVHAVTDSPIVVITAHGTEAAGIRSIQDGAQDYFLKGEFSAALLGRAVLYAVERARLQRSLVEREANFRNLIDVSVDAMVALTPDGRVIFANQAAVRLLGRSAAELEGNPFGLPVTGDRAAEIEIPRRDSDEPIIADMRVAEVFWMGQPVLLATLRDVTGRERQRREVLAANRELTATLRELDEAQAELVQRQRSQAIGQVVGGMAHDFNNALTPVVGALDFMLSEPDWERSRETITEALESALASAQDAAEVVGRLHRLFKQRDTSEDERISGERLLTESRKQARRLGNDDDAGLAGRVTTRCSVDTDLAVTGNLGELTRALAEIMDNAVEAVGDRGTISLRAGTSGDRLVIEVTDDGPGMSGKMLATCFEPFSSTKGPQRNGLGLAMVKAVVEAHGGEVEAEAGPAGGTTIRVLLPAVEPAADAPPVPPGPEVSEIERILLLEPDPVSRKMLHRFLVRGGTECISVSDVEAGLLQAGKLDFDIVVADHSFGDFAPDDLVERLREAGSDAKVLLLGEATETSTGAASGGVRRLAKPFKMKTLRETLADLQGVR